jgi:hypothetical protein
VDRGIIPRTLSLIFHELATRSNSSYSVGNGPHSCTDTVQCHSWTAATTVQSIQSIVHYLRQVHMSCVEIYNEHYALPAAGAHIVRGDLQ